jgi:hypothetical protein
MAQESILDRLDRNPGGARQYVATLLVVGGASRTQIAEALARKYDIAVPTTRSISAWKNTDPELRELIRQMEAAKRDVAPGGDPLKLMPREVNKAQVDSDLFSLCVDVPAFALLIAREDDRRAAAAADGSDPGSVGAFEQVEAAPPAPLDPDDDGPEDDVLAVLLADHETLEDFAADCQRRLGDWMPSQTPTAGAGALTGYEPLEADDAA